MSNYKEDLRLVRTRSNLRRALLELLSTDQFDKITVKKICDTALINRITFYKHYEDKVQLLNDTMLNLKDNILSKIPGREAILSKTDAVKYINNVIQIVINSFLIHKDLVNLFMAQQSTLISKMISDIIKSYVKELLETINDKVAPLATPINIVTEFISGGIATSVYYWLNHQQECPKDRLLVSIKTYIDKLAKVDILSE